jgi:hypothetical protein
MMSSMETPLSDTDAETARIHIEMLRRASPGQRAQMAFSLSARVIALARRAIGRAHPGSSEQETGLRFVAAHYGEELARELRQYLAARP